MVWKAVASPRWSAQTFPLFWGCLVVIGQWEEACPVAVSRTAFKWVWSWQRWMKQSSETAGPLYMCIFSCCSLLGAFSVLLVCDDAVLWFSWALLMSSRSALRPAAPCYSLSRFRRSHSLICHTFSDLANHGYLWGDLWSTPVHVGSTPNMIPGKTSFW